MLNIARRTIALAALAVAIIAAAVALDLPSAAAQSEDEQAGRIVARRLDDGRTEFGWQPAGGARVLPSARYFPTDALVDRWLNSSPVEVDGTEIGRINARLRGDGRIEFAFTPTDGERILTAARYFPLDARVGRWLRSTEIAIGPQPTSTQPPESSTAFTAVSAGAYHGCAIRAGGGAITCWGANFNGAKDAPAGSFSAVSAGNEFTCAIRAGNGEIECWGSNYRGERDAPAGSFSAVSARRLHACGLRDTGEIECWGSDRLLITNVETEETEIIYTGQTDAPSGRFTAVSAGGVHTCAIRAESGAIECWGGWNYGETDAPSGRFTAVSAGSVHSCAIRAESGAIECWGNNQEGKADAPTGRFTAVSAGEFHTCAIRAESGAIVCWGRNHWGQADAPSGSFSAVSAYSSHTCAIRAGNGAIVCWGRNDWGQTDAPAP